MYLFACLYSCKYIILHVGLCTIFRRRSSSKSVKLTTLHEENVRKGHDSLTFKFSEAIFYYGISSDDINTSSSDTSSGSYRTAYDCSRESETSFGHIPIVPKPFMDISTHSEESQYLSSSNNRDIDRISLSSTTSSTGYSRRPESGGTPLYMPMNKNSAGHSPGSNNSKVSVRYSMQLSKFFLFIVCLSMFNSQRRQKNHQDGIYQYRQHTCNRCLLP